MTSSLIGTASNHLPLLVSSGCCEVSLVVYNKNVIPNKTRFYKKKLRKILSIGFFGALNGVRMRRWFESDLKNYIEFKSLDKLCEEKRIPFVTVNSINTEETKALFIHENADLGISLGNGYIRNFIFNIPKFGMINIHHELLPEYQNAQSVIWQIYNKSFKTGFTIHRVNKFIDEGEILYKQEIDIAFDGSLSKTVSKTSANLLKASAKGLLHVIEHYEQVSLEAKPQGLGRKYTTPNIWQFIRIYFNHWRLRKLNKSH